MPSKLLKVLSIEACVLEIFFVASSTLENLTIKSASCELNKLLSPPFLPLKKL